MTDAITITITGTPEQLAEALSKALAVYTGVRPMTLHGNVGTTGGPVAGGKDKHHVERTITVQDLQDEYINQAKFNKANGARIIELFRETCVEQGVANLKELANVDRVKLFDQIRKLDKLDDDIPF